MHVNKHVTLLTIVQPLSLSLSFDGAFLSPSPKSAKDLLGPLHLGVLLDVVQPLLRSLGHLHLAQCFRPPIYRNIRTFLKWGYPQIIHLNWSCHCTASILGYLHIWKPPHEGWSILGSTTLPHPWDPASLDRRAASARDSFSSVFACNHINHIRPYPLVAQKTNLDPNCRR